MRNNIGTFLQDAQGAFHGKLLALGLPATSVLFEPVLDKRDGQPDFRLIADPVLNAYEIGAAWRKQKDNMTYYFVSIESPLLAAPLHAALFQDKENAEKFNLVFDRYHQVPRIAAEATLHHRRYIGAGATP